MVDTEKALWCIKNGEIGDLKTLLSQSNTKADDLILKKRPAILHAADYGQTEVVKFLIEKGANVNIVDEYGICPLLAAIWEGHAETAEVLLKSGAKKDMKSPEGKSISEEAPNDKIKALLGRY